MPSTEDMQKDKVKTAVEYFMSLMPKSKLVEVKDAVHAYMWLSKPEECKQIIENFFESLDNERKN